MPLIPILFGLVTQVVPKLFDALISPKAGDIAGRVISVAQAVTGTDSQEAAAEALRADPAKLAALQVQLAQIALDAAKADYADAASARQMQVSSLQVGSKTSWMPYLFAFVIVGVWAAAVLHISPNITPADAAGVSSVLGPIIGFIYGNNRSAATEALLANSVPPHLLGSVSQRPLS